MSRNVTAEKIYLAYCAAAEDGDEMLPWPELVKQPEHRAWFAVANAVDEIAAPPTDVVEPYDYELTVPIERRRVGDVGRRVDGGQADRADEFIMEKLPTTLRIRGAVADDLCHREFNDGDEAFNSAIYAHIHGVELSMYLDRIAPVDANAARALVADAKGAEAWMLMMGVFIDAGGALVTKDGGTVDHDANAWIAAAFELLTEFHEDRGGYYTLRSRSSSDIEVGPLRVRHLNTYSSVGERKTEWDARFATLAQATGIDESVFRRMRTEDATRAWACVDMLKKKVELEAAAQVLLVRGARLSTRSTGGDQTSKTSPSSGS